MKRISQKYVIIVVVLIVGLLFLNFIPGLSSALGNLLFKIFSPIQIFFAEIGSKVGGFFNILFSLRTLLRENAELRQKNLEMETELTGLKEVERENEILRMGLDISQKGYQVIEEAWIVGKDIQGIQDWVLINKGGKEGIEKDMTVVSPERALVGKVTEVMADFSKVMLITNKESLVAALIEGERSEGLVKKSGEGKLFMDFIPRNEKLETEERILTSGTDNVYPKGILIGKIENIDLSQNQLFQKISISPAVDFSKLEEVFIIK
jgi:rod shape-determining protein MreC